MPEPTNEDAPADAASSAALVPGHGPRIGVLTPLTGGLFWGEIISGIVQAVGEAGGTVTLIKTLDAGAAAGSYAIGRAEPVAWEHLDGFLAQLRSTDDEYLRRLRATGKPVVAVSDHTRDLDAASVTIDNVAGIRESVVHLIEHGHTRIGFLGHPHHSDIRERYEAYRSAMTEHGLEPGDLIPAPDDLTSGGNAVATAITGAEPAWTAVVAGTDANALGLMGALRELGVSVPQEIAVIGFDDTAYSWLCDPPLTTSRQLFDKLGAAAARTLLDELAGNPPEHWRHTVPTKFMVRASCGCDAARPRASAEVMATVEAMVEEITGIFGVTAGSDPQTWPTLEQVDCAALDAAIAESVQRVLVTPRGHEDVRPFLQQSARRIADLAAQAARSGSRSWESFEYALTQIAATPAQVGALDSLGRIVKISIASDSQFDIGMALLAHDDKDPAALRWMEGADLRAGLLGLWDGPPAAGRLRIVGAHGLDGELERFVGTVFPVREFPPAEIVDCAESANGEVTFVIPVRGSSGDHGLLCAVGRAGHDLAFSRSGYEHWAALLAERLREKYLLEEIRHREERYAFAARAANDGLWEWSSGTGEAYVSPRGRELLGAGADEAVTAESLRDHLHPDDVPAVMAAFATAADSASPVEVECRRRPRDGQAPWVLIRALGVDRGADGKGLVGSISDIDRRKALEEQLRRAALVDALTGLPNRRLFLDRLRREISRTDQLSGRSCAVFFLDLDGFKLINDSLGHLAGDELLRVVGERIREALRPSDTAARFGGDEFAILLSDQVPEDLLVVAERIQERISAPVTLGSQEVRVTASIGITTTEGGHREPEDILRDADTAMYSAKVEHGAACLFDPSMHRAALERLRMRGEVAAALQNGEFVVHYQPIVDLPDPTVTRFEALARWQHPDRGLIGPPGFLPALEGNAGIVDLDRLVLDTVCAQIATWRALTPLPVQVSVNVSHRTFWSQEFLESVRSTLQAHAVPPECVVLELTENIMMTDPDQARATMAGLRDLGVSLYIDDFGTGHSSLHLLRTFPLDTLKIAGPFVRELTQTYESAALTRTIIAMAAALGMSTIAECVETPEQAERLLELGCTTVQGWLFAKAMAPDEATAALGTRLEPLTVPGA